MWADFFKTKSHQIKPTLGKVGIDEKVKMIRHQKKTGPQKYIFCFVLIRDSIS